MAVKVSIELSEQQLALAEEMTRSLGYQDLSSFLAAMIEEVAAHNGGSNASRDEVPDDRWLNQEEFWKGYDEQRKARTKK